VLSYAVDYEFLAEIVNKSTSLTGSLSKLKSSSGSSNSGGGGSSGSPTGGYTNVKGIGNVSNGDGTVLTKSGSYDPKTGNYSITNYKTGEVKTGKGSQSDYDKEYNKFLGGGETQSTGLHWLDGKIGKPERILSPEQTASFNKLVDLLPKLDVLSIALPKIPDFSKINNTSKSTTIDKGITIENLNVQTNSATNLVSQLQSLVRLTNVQYST
jgi:hypothetical protein